MILKTGPKVDLEDPSLTRDKTPFKINVQIWHI
jgi:hypothetical protein